MAEPVTCSYITLGPAERIDLWADFSKRKVGDELVLKSLAFTGATHQMGGMEGIMHGGELPLGSEFTVLKVRVEQAVNDDHNLEHEDMGMMRNFLVRP